jgi:hypothetical protein
MGISIPKLLKNILLNQFHFVGITGPDFIIGLAIVDLKYLTNGFFYIYDRKNNTIYETKKLSLPKKGSIKPSPEKSFSKFNAGNLQIEINHNKIKAKGNGISIDIELDLTNISPLRVCTKSGYRGWAFTQKTTPINLSGEITLNKKRFLISSPSYMGLIDWTIGFMRHETFWNWAAITSTLDNKKSFGMNLSCGVNETGFTENAFWLDKKITKVDTINFIFDNQNLYKKWHISSNDKKVNLSFYPENHRSEKTSLFFIASNFTQLVGTFEGSLKTDDGEIIKINNCPGWAEDHFAKW